MASHITALTLMLSVNVAQVFEFYSLYVLFAPPSCRHPVKYLYFKDNLLTTANIPNLKFPQTQPFEEVDNIKHRRYISICEMKEINISMRKPVADLHSKLLDATNTLTPGPIISIFMQFSSKLGRIIGKSLIRRRKPKFTMLFW